MWIYRWYAPCKRRHGTSKVLESGVQVMSMLGNESISGVRISATEVCANTQMRSAEYEVHPMAYHLSRGYLRRAR